MVIKVGKQSHLEPRKGSEQAAIKHTDRNPRVHRYKLPSSSYEQVLS